MTLRRLIQNKAWVISTADKGNSTGIMTIKQYIELAYSIVNWGSSSIIFVLALLPFI